MISDNLPQQQTTPHQLATPVVQGSYLDWSAILAGAVFALALSFLLISFGAGLGLSLTSPYGREGVSAAWLAIASGIWFIWVMVTAFGAGGYLTGRMRRRIGDATPDEVGARDGVHGLMVWAVGALISTVIAMASVGGLVNAGASAIGSAAGTAANLATDSATTDYFSNVMLRSGQDDIETAPDADGDAISDTDTGPDTGTTSTPQPSVTSGTDLTNIDPAVQQQVAGILLRSATSGEMADRDRTYLAQLVAANTSLTPEAALTRVDTINTEIADARTATLDAVENARIAGIIFGFIAAATLLIGAVAAFFSATAGGHHRDEGLGLEILMARK
jgi:hypothetical protein